MGIIQFKKMKELIKLKYMNQKISRQMLPKIKAPKFKANKKGLFVKMGQLVLI